MSTRDRFYYRLLMLQAASFDLSLYIWTVSIYDLLLYVRHKLQIYFQIPGRESNLTQCKHSIYIWQQFGNKLTEKHNFLLNAAVSAIMWLTLKPMIELPTLLHIQQPLQQLFQLLHDIKGLVYSTLCQVQLANICWFLQLIYSYHCCCLKG